MSIGGVARSPWLICRSHSNLDRRLTGNPGEAYAEWQPRWRDSELKFALTTHQIIRVPAAAVPFAQALEFCLTVGRREQRCGACASD